MEIDDEIPYVQACANDPDTAPAYSRTVVRPQTPMAVRRQVAARRAAEQHYTYSDIANALGEDAAIEVDTTHAPVSWDPSEPPHRRRGAFVQAWVWVPDAWIDVEEERLVDEEDRDAPRNPK